MASDKGWNDPPSLSYSTAGTTGPVRKTILNKRVAFPTTGSLVDGSNVTTAESASGGITLIPAEQNIEVHPPKTTAIVIPQARPADCVNAHSELMHNSKENPSVFSKESVQQDLRKETIEVLKTHLAMCLATLQKRTAEDIARRLEILSSMWLEGKLNDDVHVRMHQCSQALLNGDYDRANNIHLALIVDHASQVTPWMVGVKHLIHESRNAGLHLKTKDDNSQVSVGNTNDDSQGNNGSATLHNT